MINNKKIKKDEIYILKISKWEIKMYINLNLSLN